MTTHRDAPLATLLHPFQSGQLTWPNDFVLFLRARDGAELRDMPRANLHCEQSFKPAADALSHAGFTLVESDERRFELILVLPPRQRDEARALFARATTLVKDGGRIVAAASNDEGARSHEADLKSLTGSVSTSSKNKCRVFWTAPIRTGNITTLCNEWLALDATRPIADGRFVSRPGVFAWDRIDVASALLAQHLPADLSGIAADLGAGYGYLSTELLSRCPGITALDVYEAERRALELARINAKSDRARLAFHWHDVCAGLPRQYDVIVTNPPFHSQSAVDRPDIGQRFIAVAAQSLRPNGRLWLVANRHLPYERVLDANFGTVRVVAQAQGFKIIEAVKRAP